MRRRLGIFHLALSDAGNSQIRCKFWHRSEVCWSLLDEAGEQVHTGLTVFAIPAVLAGAQENR